MIFFSQRKPKPFDYKPRFYDPEQERRQERRRELGLDSAVHDAGGSEYRPGMYVREQVHARRSQRPSRRRQKTSMLRLAVMLVLLVGIAYLFFFR